MVEMQVEHAAWLRARDRLKSKCQYQNGYRTVKTYIRYIHLAEVFALVTMAMLHNGCDTLNG